MATDSLVSTCAVVAANTGKVSDPANGTTVLSLHGGWKVRTTQAGVTISKASTFGGSQAAPVFPVTLEEARQLRAALFYAVT